MTTVAEATDEPQVRSWERFFKKYLRGAINEAALAWPERRSIMVEWNDLNKHDTKLAEDVLTNTTQALARAAEALKLVDVPTIHEHGRPRLRVRVRGLPTADRLTVKDLRVEHLGRLVAVRGLVKRASAVLPKVVDALYQCARCGAIVREAQEEHGILKEPVECYGDQGGCGRDSSWKIILTETHGQSMAAVDNQVLEVQETPEEVRGFLPRRVKAVLEDELCDTIRPGQRATLNGILRGVIQREHGLKKTTLALMLDVLSIEVDESDDVRALLPTPEERARIEAWAREPKVAERLVASFAPTVHGCELEKLSILLQLFGGVTKRVHGTRLRGEIHVLLTGDPGVAKSTLLRAARLVAPRSVWTTGKGTTGAGLIAAAVHDNGPASDGRWTLEAGAMVLAHLGVMIADELDKMDPDDRDNLHEAMEQGHSTVTKAGMNVELPTECSVLGGANPKAGRYVDGEPPAEQINFPPTLLSRFDVVLVLRDTPDQLNDSVLARHMLAAHLPAAADREALGPVFPPEMVRKWVALARLEFAPEMTHDAGQHLVKHWLSVRATWQPGEGMPITRREFHAAVRLAEASARMRLSKTVTIEDAERASMVLRSALLRLAEKNGRVDIGRIDSPVPMDQAAKISKLKQFVRTRQNDTDHGAPIEAVLNDAELAGILHGEAEAKIRALLQQREPPIYEPRPGFLKVMLR